jgi:hypothetical protein
MKHPASIWPFINRTAAHETGKANAHFAPLPVNIVVNESANRPEFRFDCLAEIFCWIQAAHEGRRAELMAREMHRYANDRAKIIAAAKQNGSRSNTSNGKRKAQGAPP